MADYKVLVETFEAGGSRSEQDGKVRRAPHLEAGEIKRARPRPSPQDGVRTKGVIVDRDDRLPLSIGAGSSSTRTRGPQAAQAPADETGELVRQAAPGSGPLDELAELEGRDGSEPTARGAVSKGRRSDTPGRRGRGAGAATRCGGDDGTGVAGAEGSRREAPLIPRPPPIDAVTALTVFLVLSFVIPSPLIFKPLGEAARPGNLLGLAFLLWWVLAKVGSGLGVDRGRQPVRIALSSSSSRC